MIKKLMIGILITSLIPNFIFSQESRQSLDNYLYQEYKKDEILVEFKNGMPPEFQGKKLERITDKIFKVKVGNVPEAMEKFRAMGLNAQPNYIRNLHQTIEEENCSAWGTKFINADKITKTGNRVVIAVIDTGVDYNHPDLKDRIWINQNDPPDGQDNDNNGYIDDTKGWDFFYNDNDPKDDFSRLGIIGHGTEVAGIISQVAPEAKIMILKVSDRHGNIYDSKIIEAIRYIISMNSPDLIIAGVNASWGGEKDNPFLREAIEELNKKGIILIASAGNNGSTKENFPAAYSIKLPNVVSVGAIDKSGGLAGFSNRGTWVDISAPGVEIKAPEPGGNYTCFSGTSASAPHVSGVVALLAAFYQGKADFETEELKELVKWGSRPEEKLAQEIYTGGIADPKIAINNFKAKNVPSIPKNYIRFVSWKSLSLNGNSQKIRAYEVRFVPQNQIADLADNDLFALAERENSLIPSEFRLRNLNPNKNYDILVRPVSWSGRKGEIFRVNFKTLEPKTIMKEDFEKPKNLWFSLTIPLAYNFSDETRWIIKEGYAQIAGAPVGLYKANLFSVFDLRKVKDPVLIIEIEAIGFIKGQILANNIPLKLADDSDYSDYKFLLPESIFVFNIQAETWFGCYPPYLIPICRFLGGGWIIGGMLKIKKIEIIGVS